MRSASVTGVVAALLLSGCSLIYDPGDFSATDAAQAPDGMPDARPIDAQINDADIANLDLLGTEPVDLAEGSGCIWDGDACTEAARAVPIVVNGSNIHPSATVTLSGAGFTDAVVPAVFGEDHNQLAIAVRIPPDLGIDDTGTATLTITVAQGEVSDSVDVTVAGLDDFVASAAGATVDVATLDARYATVNLDAAIRFTGAEPVRLVATSSLVLDGSVDVNGANGGTAVAGGPGPGGCPGGANGTPGNCGDGGGRGGADNVGGGGGGHRTDGTAGAGPGGDAGEASGDESLAPLSGGNGGGGGGDGAVAGMGGGGGGGGGVIVLTSEGSLHVGASGAINANGGGGSAGGGTCLLNQHGGGGGGGSGGAILVRARGTFTADDATQRAFVNAGPKGDAPTGTGCNDGGAGAPGRVRIDLASSAADPGMVSGTAAFRGIAIDPALAPIVTEAQVMVGVFGAPNHTYRIQVEGQAAQDVTVLGSRMGSATVDLSPGQNRICVLVNASVTAASDEGAQCVTIAFMPQ